MCSHARCTATNGANGIGMITAKVRVGTATAMACRTAMTGAPTIHGVTERRLVTAKAGFGFLDAGFFAGCNTPQGALHHSQVKQGRCHDFPARNPPCNALRVLHPTRIQHYR
jgi:hypothetical protein